MELLSSSKAFGGSQRVYRHQSSACACPMTFAIFLPPQAEESPVPVLWYLSGLTCSHQNVMDKGEYRAAASANGIASICPDTSPRGEGVPDADSYDLGQGAGFYINATQEPWQGHYRMYDYIVEELPALIEAHFPVTDARGISGHSMGGHGALMIALRNPGRYRSVSAFSPIVAPSQVPWGEKAFGAYLGEDREAWKAYDACELLRRATERLPILVDQGLGDEFLEMQLKPARFQTMADACAYPITLRLHAGYDHSYYFIASFIGEHLAHHARALGA
jgi:S-formylglutathione hydrolase